ncbi:MAG: ABC transporter permease [Tannerellaceae bacterium]|nr:ABC transporter permease [Tannerellaceae bacterium]
MNFSLLVRANAGRYRRYYRLIAAASLIVTALVSGSLMTGDSVRHTLTERLSRRLGNTETLIFSSNSFFSESLAAEPALGGSARPVLLSQGFISHEGRLIPVMVWGTDEPDIPAGAAMINRQLAGQLAESAPSDIVLRLPAAGLVPSGSLFVTDNYTTSLRLALAGILEAASGGDISLKNEQIIPCNIFLRRAELASAMEIEGKANLILSDSIITAEALAAAWRPATSGISLLRLDGSTEIGSDRVFLQTELVDAIARDNPGANRLFSYMANSIESASGSLPYSFVTAIDAYAGLEPADNEIVLSDYAAARLKAGPNDSISLTYFVSSDLKTLREESISLRVAGILPLEQLSADKTLSADFPGLSDVERCTDWDSDMPINMDRITKEDEDYWTLYRSTPKALVAYRTLAPRWSNAYGSATAVRTADAPDLGGLNPAMLGLRIVYPRAIGLEAARGGIDFASLFLSLGFLIIFSAVLLMLLPLSEMIFERRSELALLRALGFGPGRIVKLLHRESLAVVLLASPLGVLAGACYTALSLALLNTLWNDAVHTSGFAFFPSLTTIFAGWIAGAVISLLTLLLSVWRAAGRAERPLALKPLKPARLGSFDRRRLVWAGLRMDGKRGLTSFVALASGVLIVFSVGLNRRGFADSSQLRSGTGGYSLWCETGVPVYHSMSSAEGRAKLALTDLPPGVEALQILRYGADDASCLNLNKVVRPTVLGVDMERLQGSDFRILGSIYNKEENPFDALRLASGDVYPAAIDETTLLWGLQRRLGDTLSYEAADGRPVRILLAATLPNTIFQGNLLMDGKHFAAVWPEIRGSEIALIRSDASVEPQVRQLLSQALSEYGLRLMTTSGRLREFNSVTDTYLTIFLTLGGLGLLLGLAAFIIIVRKSLAARGGQIELYRALGFADSRIASLLIAENRLIPLAAIICGAGLSLAGVSGSAANVGTGVWLTAILLMAALMLGALGFVRRAVDRKIRNSSYQFKS